MSHKVRFHSIDGVQLMSVLTVAHKPGFLKPYQVERHYYDDEGDLVRCDVYVGQQYKTRKEAETYIETQLEAV